MPVRTRVLVGVAALVALASACETVQQTATSPDYHKTRTGAGIGAAAGAVIGLLTRGDKFQNALIGGAIGGMDGGALVTYLDRQQHQLPPSMAVSGVSVVPHGNNITLAMPCHITFATN